MRWPGATRSWMSCGRWRKHIVMMEYAADPERDRGRLSRRMSSCEERSNARGAEPVGDPSHPTLGALFAGFFSIGMSGFGGVLPWARRMLVEQRGWLTGPE